MSEKRKCVNCRHNIRKEKPFEELKNQEKCFLWLACWVRSFGKKEKENEQ